MIEIPSELLAAGSNPLLTLLLIVALGAFWRLWTAERKERSAIDTLAASAMMEQKVLNERSLAQIEFRTFERDQFKSLLDRCEDEKDQCHSREREGWSKNLNPNENRGSS